MVDKKVDPVDELPQNCATHLRHHALPRDVPEEFDLINQIKSDKLRIRSESKPLALLPQVRGSHEACQAQKLPDLCESMKQGLEIGSHCWKWRWWGTTNRTSAERSRLPRRWLDTRRRGTSSSSGKTRNVPGIDKRGGGAGRGGGGHRMIHSSRRWWCANGRQLLSHLADAGVFMWESVGLSAKSLQKNDPIFPGEDRERNSVGGPFYSEITFESAAESLVAVKGFTRKSPSHTIAGTLWVPPLSEMATKKNGIYLKYMIVSPQPLSVRQAGELYRQPTHQAKRHPVAVGVLAVYYASIPSCDQTTHIDTDKYPSKLGITIELCAGIVDKELPLEEIASIEILEECGYDVPASKLETITTFRQVLLDTEEKSRSNRK
uniref:Nudix hydrolase domain-containing protein n=1 Tax=Timema monikensis TaxID=170555 RepID=A0A7R9E7J9_9NEOP|nr:unnamed protein product [Timema monikensis]